MRGIPTPSTACSSAEPFPIFPYRPRPKTTKRSPRLQRKRRVCVLAWTIPWLRMLRPVACVVMAVAPLMSLIAASTLVAKGACAESASRPESIDRFAKLVEEASSRFAVPAR
jgi:hypothetical protein